MGDLILAIWALFSMFLGALLIAEWVAANSNPPTLR